MRKPTTQTLLLDPTPYAQVASFAQFAASAQSVGNGSIFEPNIVTGGISSRTIAAGAIIPSKIAALAVTNAALANNSVTTAKIANGSITTARLADNAVTSATIADGSVGTADIANGSIGNDKLAVNAVQSAEILDHSVKVVDFAGVEGTTSINATLAAGVCVDQSLNFAGAVIGDYPILAIGLNGLLPFKTTVTALNVPAANLLTYRVCNFGSAQATIAAMPVKVLLLR